MSYNLIKFHLIKKDQCCLKNKYLTAKSKQICKSFFSSKFKKQKQSLIKMRNRQNLKNAQNLKSLIDMISELDDTLDVTEKIINKYYDKYFQICETFYSQKRDQYIYFNNFDFLKKVHALYEFQEKLLKSTLGSTKIQKLNQKFNQHFVVNYKQELLSQTQGFTVMFKNKHLEPLRLAYKMYRGLVKKSYTNYILIEIKRFLQREYNQINKLQILPSNPDFNKIFFLKKLIKFNRQHILILNSNFSELRHQYKLALQKVLSEKRSVYFNFVQIMLIYVNKIFQDHTYTKQKILIQIDQIMLILSCISMDSKISFLSNYALALSRKISNSNFKKIIEYEYLFLKELKKCIGEDQTKVIQHLLNQYQANQDKKNKINLILQNSDLNFLKVKIFEAEGWYYKAKFDMFFPGKMLQCQKKIFEVCSQINKNKKYTIDHLESRVVLTFRSRLGQVDLVLNNFQAALTYFMFNSKKKELSQKEIYIFYKTIDEKLFNQNLEQLVGKNDGILIKTEGNNFKFNHQFKSNHKMINYANFIGQQIKKKEQQPVYEMDLTTTIKAAVIRILKIQKVIKPQQLIKKVLIKLSYFKPTEQKIRQSITKLCEYSYAEKNEKTGQLIYIP